MANPHREIIKAFQRLEKREKKKERERLAKIRAEKAAEMREASEKAHRRRKRIEQITVAATLAFVGIVAATVWYTQGSQIKESYARILARAGFGGPGIRQLDCSSKKDRNTPRCLDMISRDRQTKDNWESISLHEQGKSIPFTLHGKEKRKRKE